MEEFSSDILVIGSGLAGILSALEAERPGLRVLLIGKFAIGLGTKVLAEPRLSTLILSLPDPEEIWVFNEKGEDLLEKLGIRKDFNQAIEAQRDHLSIALYEASQNGDVYFDLTKVPKEKLGTLPPQLS
jgi:succinate dehydrogenase/fumarate reductase flavoprotein subunit